MRTGTVMATKKTATLPQPADVAVIRLIFAIFAFIPAGVLPTTPAAGAADSERREFIALTELAGSLGMQSRWLDPGKEIELRREHASLAFKVESREIRLNGIRVFLGDPILPHNGGFRVSRTDAVSTIQPLLLPHSQIPAGAVRTIVLDPGHGGRDRGTSNAALGLLEKDLTMEIVRRLYGVLVQEGYRVGVTRQADEYISLEDRAKRAAAAGADLFVSLHFNAAGRRDARGVETYVLTPQFQRSTGQEELSASDKELHRGNAHDHWNALLGFLVHRQLLGDLGAFDRGFKRARFAVLREAPCPAVLVEAGYLSNPEEAARIATREYQDRLVHSLARGINEYRRATERIGAAHH